MEVSARSLISVAVLVAALMAETGLRLALEMTGDLFRTPVLEQSRFDLQPRGGIDVGGGGTGLLLFADAGARLCLLGTIAPLPAISSQFARDR